MIRKLQKTDINRVADIWLDTNLKAHDFIPAKYWKNNFQLVKEMLLQAEVYVYENDQKIQGFIGANGEHIEGIFVSGEMQSQGMGKLLLDYVKNKKHKLSLNVYQKMFEQCIFIREKVLKFKEKILIKRQEKKNM